MMERAEIKAHAWKMVKQNYKPTIGLYFLFILISFGVQYIPLGYIFLGLVFFVGCCGYFLNRFRGHETVTGMLFRPFNRYGRVLGGSAWKLLWLTLWSLLFIIPGIIKSYSYFCTEYILADSPNVEATQALELSKRMMYGNKAKVFIMHLTFIGWGLLAAAIFLAVFIPVIIALSSGYYYNPYDSFSDFLPASMIGAFGYYSLLSSGFVLLAYLPMYAYMILFLGPYFSAANAGYYLEIKRDAIKRGVVAEWEFGPSEAEVQAQKVYAQQYYAWQQQQYYQQQQQHYQQNPYSPHYQPYAQQPPQQPYGQQPQQPPYVQQPPEEKPENNDQ